MAHLRGDLERSAMVLQRNTFFSEEEGLQPMLHVGDGLFLLDTFSFISALSCKLLHVLI